MKSRTMKKARLVFVVLVIIIQACQREVTFDNSFPDDLPAGDSTYLDTIIGIEVNGASRDTNAIWVYKYDNLKRVISMQISPTDPAVPTGHLFTYAYNGIDTLPYKSIHIEKRLGLFVPETDTTTVFHFFDGAGRNLKDSLLVVWPGSQFTTVLTYAYSGNKIAGYRTSVGSPGSFIPPDQKDTALLDVNNNIIECKSYRRSVISGLFDLDYTSQFTYDTKQSPFARLSNFKTFGVFPIGETLFFEFPQPRNRVSQTEIFGFANGGTASVYEIDYTNTYKPNGLLKETIGIDRPPLPGTYSQAIFKYKSL